MHFLYCNLTLLINEIKNLQAINFFNLFSLIAYPQMISYYNNKYNLFEVELLLPSRY
jgi:hypothetical protein